ncbi:MAG: stage II sporulation protein D [Bacilli bacterium]|nr:stage II sporulation protein D [Bacilli bacterium]
MLRKVFLTALILVLIPTIINYIYFKPKTELELTDYTIRVKQVSKNKIINLSLEDYVVGVLAGEMPLNFEEEALKAQAVVARTYALKRILYENEDYDVVDTTQNQVYLDEKYLQDAWGPSYEKNIQKLKEIVSATAHEYIFFEDKVIDAMFFSTSVGMTENSEEIFPNELPYLRSVSSTWDEEASPVFKENYTFTLDKFYNLLNLTYSENVEIEKTSMTSTGRIKEIKINNVKFTGKKVQQALDLRSNYFDIQQIGDIVKIETKGYGHGVGMSQYGANGMAQEGYNYKEIINHYYQDVEIKKI